MTKLEKAQMKDTILTVLAATGPQNVAMINLELRRCGFRVGFPETKALIQEIVNDGYVDKEFITAMN